MRQVKAQCDYALSYIQYDNLIFNAGLYPVCNIYLLDHNIEISNWSSVYDTRLKNLRNYKRNPTLQVDIEKTG